MSTELSEIKASIARIDERTKAMYERQGKNAEDLADHADRDREDFKEVHSRMNKFEVRQSKFVGVGAALMLIMGPVIAFFKDIVNFFGGG